MLITKKQLIEDALKKYSSERIEEANWCDIRVDCKDNTALEIHFPLTKRGKKSKADKIRTEIRGTLKNTKPTDENKGLSGDTSSKNIKSIHIILKL